MNSDAPAYPTAIEAARELERARSIHAPMHSPHEGWAVLYEELDELWEEVREKKPDIGRMRKEAIQLAAMALRFVEDVCGPALASPESRGEGEKEVPNATRTRPLCPPRHH
jgi:hypothetical protein